MEGLMKYFFFDTETTGLDPDRCAITQLAGVLFNGEKKEDINIFMRPFPGAQISAEALEVQGQTMSHLEILPDERDGFRGLLGILDKTVDKYNREDKIFIFGWNVGFDVQFLRALFNRNGNDFFGSYFFNPPIDVMSIAADRLQDVRTGLPNFKLQTVYDFLFPEKRGTENKFHDATVDAQATLDIYEKIGCSGKWFEMIKQKMQRRNYDKD